MPKKPKKICFAIMPFDNRFKDISDVIAKSAQKCGLDYIRGDHRNKPGPIMPQILNDIKRATVIVADVTGHNANVFYELGIAHQIKGPEHVVLLIQSQDRFPFDVSALRHVVYTHSQEGLADLGKKLPACLREALESQVDREVWNIIRGPLERTRLIVRDLERITDASTKTDPTKVTIRMVSGLGSLAITNKEAPEFDSEYYRLLIQERDALRKALIQGAKLKALLHPPRWFTARLAASRGLALRYQRLIGLLEAKSDMEDPKEKAADLKAMKNCEFLLTPVPMPHLFIIGDQIAYEGMKRGGNRGYAMTHCETDEQAIQALIKDFDTHFAEVGEMMKGSQGQNVVAKLKKYFREATEQGVP